MQSGNLTVVAVAAKVSVRNELIVVVSALVQPSIIMEA